MSTTERFQPAQLNLNDITPQAVVDDQDNWTVENHRDFSKANWNQFNRVFVEKDGA